MVMDKLDMTLQVELFLTLGSCEFRIAKLDRERCDACNYV
jgi:hypothetical protein